MSLRHVKVGDKLWWVPNSNRRPCMVGEVEVIKVGRQWGHLNDPRRSRFDLDTGAVDAGPYSSPATIYESELAYSIKRDRHLAWGRLKRGIGFMGGCPEHLTAQDINGICGTLGIPK